MKHFVTSAGRLLTSCSCGAAFLVAKEECFEVCRDRFRVRAPGCLAFSGEMGVHLGLEVVAEGVKRRERVEFLLREGCLIGQGYPFARPLPAKAFEDWLRKRPDAGV